MRLMARYNVAAPSRTSPCVRSAISRMMLYPCRSPSSSDSMIWNIAGVSSPSAMVTLYPRALHAFWAECYLPVGGGNLGQVIWNVGHDHAWPEQQGGLQPQSRLVMEQVLPPFPRYELGQHHDDGLARVSLLQRVDVCQQRRQQRSVGRLDDRQGDRYVRGLPFLTHRLSRLIVVGHEHRRHVFRLGDREGEGQGLPGRQSKTGDRHDAARMDFVGRDWRAGLACMLHRVIVPADGP